MAMNSRAPSPPSASIPSERVQPMADAISIDDDSEISTTAMPVEEGEPILLETEDDLSEQQLRELYDREEIDRFLNLFAAYVTEVHLPEQAKEKELWTDVAELTIEPKAGEAQQDEWVPTHNAHASPLPAPCPQEASSGSLSEYIAYQYIVPKLPPVSPLPPFTFGRLRVTTQRLYLALQPAYRPFFVDMGRLATWQDRQSSFTYCAAFWILWWYNLLLPSLFFRIFFALIRRKIFPYPTLQELRKRRKEVARANVFGDAVQARLTPSSPFGLTELWRLFRVFNKPKTDKAKNVFNYKGKGKGKDADQPDLSNGGGGNSVPVGQGSTEAPTVLDDFGDYKETDGKRALLQTLSDIADFHERVTNIFIWRRPTYSSICGWIIFFLFLLTLLLPAKYIAKLSYAVGGIFFWHIAPVLSAMAPADRARLPPAFDEVPTDADYAMELISQRVASGLNVKPSAFKKPNKPQTQNVEIGGDDAIISDTEGQSVDWKKWGDRAALLKSWADNGKRLFTRSDTGAWPPHNLQLASTSGVPNPHIETHTFPAQHTSAPGLITLTPTTFFFTPLMSPNAKITIALKDLRGVKKIGLLKGLLIRWAGTLVDSKVTEKEEKFLWVGDRDELFARLIGRDGRRWLKV